MEKKKITITAELSVYFAPGDRVRLKHRHDIKGTVKRLTSWHGYNSVILEEGRSTLHVDHYEIEYDDRGGCFTNRPEEDHELIVEEKEDDLNLGSGLEIMKKYIRRVTLGEDGYYCYLSDHVVSPEDTNNLTQLGWEYREDKYWFYPARDEVEKQQAKDKEGVAWNWCENPFKEKQENASDAH